MQLQEVHYYCEYIMLRVLCLNVQKVYNLYINNRPLKTMVWCCSIGYVQRCHGNQSISVTLSVDIGLAYGSMILGFK